MDYQAILDGHNEPHNTMFGDEFDPLGLLNQPLFDDNQQDLDASKDFTQFNLEPTPVPEPVSASEDSSASSGSTMNGNCFHQKPHPQLQHYHFTLPSCDFIKQVNSQRPATNVTAQQQEVQQRVQEVQQQIQKVQQQIQQVQLQSTQLESQNAMRQKVLHSGMLNTGGMNTAGLGMTRTPPTRSVSMPLQRMSRGTDSNFVMQQQQNQGNQMNSMQGQGALNMNNGMNGLGSQQMDTNSINSVSSSMQMNANGLSMMQQSLEAMGNRSGTPATGVHSRQMHPSSVQIGNDGMQLNNMSPGDLSALSQASFNPSDQLPTDPHDSRGLGVGEAMEKLCESMKRSAMSRSLVKQLSGRTLTHQNSARSLTKQGSSRNLSRQNSGLRLTKQLSGRNLTRANSGRSLTRSASGRQLLGDDGAAAVPIRRQAQDTKFRIHRDNGGAPQRGIYRHKSQSALMGRTQANGNQQRTVVQIDDNPVGFF